ncbi:MFS transporter (plasmid) [Salipiger sp. H15]|uniref:MFS transporter n=1 Tax=Alloyangia sp. H15 TaxID=3029062 RepID=A0AAU8ATB2_9RHOB
MPSDPAVLPSEAGAPPGVGSELWLYLGGRLLWVAAGQITNVAMGWLVYDETRSAMALGLVGLAAFLPKLVLVLVAGLVADRVDRRLVMAVCLAVSAAVTAALAVIAAQPGLSLAAVYGLVILLGIARSFVGPASQALMANLVPRSELSRIASLASSVSKIATIGGPALAGLIYLISPWAPFAVATGCFAASVLLNLALRPRPALAVRTPVTLSAAFEGMRFIFQRPVILGAISLDLFSVLLGGVTALLPIIVSEMLMGGPAELGLLRSAPAVGAMAVGLVISWWPIRRNGGRKLFVATAIFGVSTVALAFSHSLWLSAALLCLGGAADVISVVIRQTLVQADTPDEMRGRVASVNMLFIGASNELGEFESGVTAALFGLVPAILIGGCGTLLVALVWAALFPGLRRRDRLVED